MSWQIPYIFFYIKTILFEMSKKYFILVNKYFYFGCLLCEIVIVFLFLVLWRWGWRRFYGWLIPGLWIWHCWPGKWSRGFQLWWKASHPADGSTKVTNLSLLRVSLIPEKFASNLCKIISFWLTLFFFFGSFSGVGSLQYKKLYSIKCLPMKPYFLRVPIK